VTLLLPRLDPAPCSTDERDQRARDLRTWLRGLPEDPATWPEPWAELWEERAAIQEHCGGLDRATAEREAAALLRDQFHRCGLPPTCPAVAPSRVGGGPSSPSGGRHG